MTEVVEWINEPAQIKHIFLLALFIMVWCR